jgi:hypothetical protein
MTTLKIVSAAMSFSARLETGLAPRTCAHFLDLLPYRKQIIHVRWSGEGCWIPLGDEPHEIPVENATRYPAPGQMIFYPGGFSEAEILLAYGAVAFASRLGPLAGNHFLTIVEGLEHLPALGRKTLWEGAQDILFEVA